MARVLVKRAVSVGGIRYAPTVDGTQTIPVEAVIPLERARAHGPDDVEIIETLDDAADESPAAGEGGQAGDDKT